MPVAAVKFLLHRIRHLAVEVVDSLPLFLPLLSLTTLSHCQCLALSMANTLFHDFSS